MRGSGPSSCFSSDSYEIAEQDSEKLHLQFEEVNQDMRDLVRIRYI